jgi:hypothetical protein
VLEPLDTATLKQQHQEKAAGRGKRKRRLIVDEPKNISGDDMKANMADYRYVLRVQRAGLPRMPTNELPF